MRINSQELREDFPEDPWQFCRERLLRLLDEGVTMGELARETGVNPNTVRGYLSPNATKEPGATILGKFLKYLLELEK